MANGSLTGASGVIAPAVPYAGGSHLNVGSTILTTARVVASDPGGSVGGWVVCSTFTWGGSGYSMKSTSNVFAGVTGGLALSVSVDSSGNINASGGGSETTWTLCHLDWCGA